MKTIWKIALRNIRRHTRRTLLSAITIGVGLMFFIFMDSVMSGFDRGAIDNMIELSVSALKIQTRAYDKEKDSYPLKYGISNIHKIQGFLRKDTRVKGITSRTRFLGELSNNAQTCPVVGTIVDPATDSTVFGLKKYLEGSYFSGNNDREIILGKDLARDLAVSAGDYITLFALTRYETNNADEFKVTGILKTTDPNINKSSVLISFAGANDFLDLEDLVTEINVSLVHRTNFKNFLSDMKELQASTNREFNNLAVDTFLELGAAILEMSKQKKGFGFIFMGALLLIAAVGIFNTVLMSVYERIREIGVLRAHGMKPREITWMFLLEGTITGAIGSTMGVILGCLINALLVAYGYPMDKLGGDGMDTSGIPVWGTIYGQWNIEMIIFAFFFGIIVATIAGIIPARQASKMNVTKALRFV
ncbi:MAG: FtsX-like permease family protein [bacterium]